MLGSDPTTGTNESNHRSIGALDVGASVKNRAVLSVHSDLIEGVNFDTRFPFDASKVQLSFSARSDDTCNNPITVDIQLKRSSGAHSSVELSATQQERLFEYLSNPNKEPFDCGCFIQHIFGLPVTPDTFDFSSFRMQEYQREQTVAVGDAIVLYDQQSKKPLHFALSLGEDLYLFKIGWRSNEQLSVGSFGAMAEHYGSYAAKTLSPRVPPDTPDSRNPLQLLTYPK